MADDLKTIFSAFKLRGLSLRRDAKNYLTEIFQPINEVEREEWVDILLDEICKTPLTNNLIDVEVLQSAIQRCNATNKLLDGLVTVIDAFDVPSYSYVMEKKKFVEYSRAGAGASAILGRASCRVQVFQERYKLLLQRTLRHELFIPALPNVNDDQKKKFQLKNTEYLRGCSSKVKDVIVLGMLSQIKDGKYFLEDLVGTVEVDLSNAKFHAGLFTEGCFILAEGSYVDSVFHISALGFPPHETSLTTRAYYGNFNFYGESIDHSADSLCHLKSIEMSKTDVRLVFLADVWLDQDHVLAKLDTLFSRLKNCPPTCFIFCGNFVSKPHTFNLATDTKDGLNNLMKLILQYPNICTNSAFIFVPSLEDATPAKTLPRPSVPEILTETFRKKVPNVTFSSNPCRLEYCSQNIVILCEDIVYKMSQSSIKRPTGNIPSHFVQTIVCQSHLCPLPSEILPIYWQYDQSLWLYPLPDLVIITDHQMPSFQETAEGDCVVKNLTSFSTDGFSFEVYSPSSKVIKSDRITE